MFDIEQAKQQLRLSKEKFDRTKNQVSESISRQLGADYSNCQLAMDMAEQTGTKVDISLFEWLVREFSDEVSMILEMDEIRVYRESGMASPPEEDET